MVKNILFLILIVFIAVAGLFYRGSDNLRFKNVILISVDTLNQSALRVFNPKAREFSNLDKFSDRALCFENAYSTSSWTLPAHASLLTGLYPDRHGAADERRKISENVLTMASLLQENGFETVSFNGEGYLHQDFGFSTGFDIYNAKSSAKRIDLVIPRDGKPHPMNGKVLFDRAIAYLLQRKTADPPFFLFLQTYAVHDYFKLHPWSVQSLGDAPIRNEDYYLNCLLGRGVCSDNDWLILEALYQSDLYNLDHGFQHLLVVLKKLALEDSTLLVFVSDHGEGFDVQNGRTHHGGRLTEEMIRVPLMIAGPGIEAKVAGDPVSLVDIMPTILDLLAIPVPQGLDGVSFAGTIRGKESEKSRPLFAMEHYYWWINGERVNVKEVLNIPVSLAVIKDNFWYIHEPSGEKLYNMEKDPKQKINLKADLTQLQRLRDTFSKRKHSRPPIRKRGKNKLLEEQLQSLGYLQ